MNNIAVVAEFNPFHNGHKHFLQTIKQTHKADNLIVILSGNFTMRGDICVCDKYQRANQAILGGADLVIELPPAYALSPADRFCFGAVKTLSLFAKLNYLAFGSESGNINTLNNLSNVLDGRDHNPLFKKHLKTSLDSGECFVKAQSQAIKKICTVGGDAFDKPNNILAINYISAIKKLGLNLQPLTLLREDNFNSSLLNFNNPSAKAIRRELVCGNDITPYVPGFVNKKLCVNYNAFDLLRFTSFKLASASALSALFDVCEGLENRLYNCAQKTENFTNFFEMLKTKRYTTSKLMRIMLYNLFGVTSSLVLKTETEMPVINVLAVNKNKKALIGEFDDNKCHIITKPMDIKNCPANLHIQLIEKCNSVYEICSNSKMERRTIYV